MSKTVKVRGKDFSVQLLDLLVLHFRLTSRKSKNQEQKVIRNVLVSLGTAVTADEINH